MPTASAVGYSLNMCAQSRLRRIIALQLLLALPAVAGARLGLDVQAQADASAGVEVQHSVGCSAAHDHRFCALLMRSPWSPGPGSPSVTPLMPPIALAVPATLRHAPNPQLQPATARAPPRSG